MRGEMTDLTDHVGDGGARIVASGQLEGLFEPQRVILFVAAAGTVSDRLIYALTREFPWVVVESVEDVQAACRRFDRPVALILIDASLIRAVEQCASELVRCHPHALIAAIQRDDMNSECSYPDILNLPSVRGVLPMNVRLDIWLSVLRLMLCGGEYFPPEMLHRYARGLADTRTILSSYDTPSTSRSGGGPQVGELTAREVQILEMVARGLQNKTIAAEFRLSEHTVKIHLHNIISKLGAHNRTEAVAKFRQLRERRLTSAGNGHWSTS
jgi:DNA-binding NarL/FixJ family response regulator